MSELGTYIKLREDSCEAGLTIGINERAVSNTIQKSEDLEG